MTRKLFHVVVALAFVALSSGSAQAAPGDWARARLQESQQRIDQAEARIGEIVRAIANAGSPQSIAELNQQLKAWETERSNAQFALYQAREQLRILATQESQLKADIGAFIQASRQFAADVQRLKTDSDAHNADAAAQRQAVQYFNSLPANQRSQAEADRLNRWRDEVNARRDRLISRQGALERRRSELLQWENTLKERARQFENG